MILTFIILVVLELEQKVNYYNNQIRAARLAVEETLKKVHEQNRIKAEALGLTLDEWHKMMQKIGEGGQNLPIQKNETETIPPVYNSADYVLNYLFRPKKKKRLKLS